jgi:stage II sporulation protein M
MGEWNPLLIMGYILLNNVAKSLGALLLGVAIGIPPIFFIAVNGFTLGLVAYDVEQTMGVGYVLAALIPHGVVELPAVILSSAMGIRIGIRVIERLRGEGGSVKAEMRRCLKGYAVRVLPLLIVASALEVSITPAVVGLLFPQP